MVTASFAALPIIIFVFIVVTYVLGFALNFVGALIGPPLFGRRLTSTQFFGLLVLGFVVYMAYAFAAYPYSEAIQIPWNLAEFGVQIGTWLFHMAQDALRGALSNLS